jgi:hypothetical protein
MRRRGGRAMNRRTFVTHAAAFLMGLLVAGAVGL